MAAEIENHPCKTGSEILKNILLSVLDAIYIGSTLHGMRLMTQPSLNVSTRLGSMITFSLTVNVIYVFQQPPQLIVSFFLGLRIPPIAWCAVGDPGLLKFCPAFRFSPL